MFCQRYLFLLWMDEILHPLETIAYWHVRGDSPIQRFLDGAGFRPSTVFSWTKERTKGNVIVRVLLVLLFKGSQMDFPFLGCFLLPC